MKAVWIAEHGSTDVLQIIDRDVPEPSPNEVRLAVRAAGLNHLDLWVRRGVPGHRFPLPLIPGCDMAGVVDAIGSHVRSASVGDRVAVAPGHSCGVCEPCVDGRQNLCRQYGIFGETCNGSNAEYVCVPESNLLPMPDSMDFVQAAAAPLVFLTAWHMLVDRCGIKAGDDVLIHAAGSGVSMAAIQIARFHGARVITTASQPEKLAGGLALGAEFAINYNEERFSKRVREITNKRGVDIVVDHVGGDTIGSSLKCLAAGGRLVTCGATSSPVLEADLRLIFFKNLSILGSTMGGLGEMRTVWKHVSSGALAPIVAEVLRMDEVQRAHTLLEERAVFGKVVLQP